MLIGEGAWQQALTVWGGIALIGLWLTHMLRAASKTHDWFALSTGALLGRAVASVAIISAVLCWASILLTLTVYGSPVTQFYATIFRKLPVGVQILNQSIAFSSVVIIWVALYFGLMSQRWRHRAELRQAQLNEALQAAELRLLKFQLNPHFLFNALNGVRALIAENPRKRRKPSPVSRARCATRLRRAMRSSSRFGRELEMVNDYLALESLRLAERLDVRARDLPGAESVRIPALLMQTLVENAIKHGIAPLKHGGTLRISRARGRQAPAAGDRQSAPGRGREGAARRPRAAQRVRAAAAVVRAALPDWNWTCSIPPGPWRRCDCPHESAHRRRRAAGPARAAAPAHGVPVGAGRWRSRRRG